MRLFIAAELPDTLLEALAETQALLRDCIQGRYVAPSNFHVTLAFIGELSGSRLNSVYAAFEESLQGFSSSELVLGEFGMFGKATKATLWQKVTSNGTLETMAASVRRALLTVDLPYDKKAFLAHVTLMRSAYIFGQELPMPHIARHPLERVTLFSSNLSGAHPVYEPLASVNLY